MKASIVVVTHAGGQRLDDSLGSLESYGGHPDVEVILVDNGAPEGTAATVAGRFPWARSVRAGRNLGFAAGAVLGVTAARGDVLIFLNDDAAAGDGFVEAHLETLGRHGNAAASGGSLVSWDGTRHDFVRGAVTFDAHAFQVGQGRRVDELMLPTPGEPLPFACGGNMAIRRIDWNAAGGFDPDLFAYFEDVELGWRLWALGREVVAAPDAAARHRGAATSSTLGDFRRGVLYERNALRTFNACADDEHRGAFGPAVYATFLHRLVAFAGSDPEQAAWIADPFGGAASASGRWQRWRRRVAERGPLAALRHAITRVVVGPDAGRPRLGEGHLLMQLRAAQGFFAGAQSWERRRRQLERARSVPDRDIVSRFPRLIVPTYHGDRTWFASDAFRSMLPDGWPVEDAELDEVMALHVER